MNSMKSPRLHSHSILWDQNVRCHPVTGSYLEPYAFNPYCPTLFSEDQFNIFPLLGHTFGIPITILYMVFSP